MGAYDRIIWHGKTFNKRTVAMLSLAEKKLTSPLVVYQGSYNSGVSQSAGTHDGGGAVDLDDADWVRVVRILRTVGFAAWYRPAISGLWSAHIHAIAIGDAELSSGAKNQVVDYYNHKDGLAGDNWDSFWRPSPIPVFRYRTSGDSSDWSSGEVYVEKLRKGVTDSDSVRRLKYRLKNHNKAGSPNLKINGHYGPGAVDAVAKWQRVVAETGDNNGLQVTGPQAERLFGKDYALK